MRPVLRISLCLFLTLVVLTCIADLALAQESDFIGVHTRPRTIMPQLMQPALLLETAILKKIGIPYRFYGTDDNGYDCSGFVWRVFQEAGFNFERMRARELWQLLPEATPEEEGRFGTLVFFNNLSHVGIVRDACSFYHASLSQGVAQSPFAGYWENRIIGYRRAPLDAFRPAGQDSLVNVRATDRR